MNRRNMPQGEQDVTGTSSIEMPQALKSLFEMQSPMQPAPMTEQSAGGMQSRMGIGPEQLGATGGMGANLPSYQQGGMIGADGNPIRSSEFLSGPRPSGQWTGRLYDKAIQKFGNPYGYAEQAGLQPQIFPTVSGRPDMDRPESPLSVAQLNQMANRGMLASYQEGGMIGPDGMPVPEGMPSEMPAGMPSDMPPAQGVGLAPQAGQEAPMDPQMLEMNLNQFVNQNPQQMEELRMAILQELQSGELTAQELNQMVQLATVAAQNPEMYSYVRNFAIQQGIATEADLPQQYDQGLVFSMLLAGRAVQQAGQGGMEVAGAPTGGMPTTQPGMAPEGMAPMGGEPVIPSMAMGGPVGSMSDSKPVVIEAHTGEYVIPKNVVEMKGKEFFDSLVEKYRDNK